MDLPVSCDTTQGVMIHANPHSAATTEFPSGQPVALAGPLEIVKESGDGDFRQDSLSPNDFEVLSGSAAGESIFAVTGTDAAGNKASDRVVLTVSLFVPPIPPLDSLGLTADAPSPKA